MVPSPILCGDLHQIPFENISFAIMMAQSVISIGKHPLFLTAVLSSPVGDDPTESEPCSWSIPNRRSAFIPPQSVTSAQAKDLFL
jgi:hypothetical protein